MCRHWPIRGDHLHHLHHHPLSVPPVNLQKVGREQYRSFQCLGVAACWARVGLFRSISEQATKTPKLHCTITDLHMSHPLALFFFCLRLVLEVRTLSTYYPHLDGRCAPFPPTVSTLWASANGFLSGPCCPRSFFGTLDWWCGIRSSMRPMVRWKD